MTYLSNSIAFRTDVDLDEIASASAVRSELARSIRAALAGVNGRRTVTRVTVPLDEEVGTATFLRQDVQAGTVQQAATYWSGRGEHRSTAALGAAEVLAGDDGPIDAARVEADVTQAADGLPDDARYYGGMRFDAAQPADDDHRDAAWAPFGTYRFVLPRFELIREGTEQHLACNLVGPRDVQSAEDVLKAVDRLVLPVPHPGLALPSPRGRRDVPERTAWIDTIRHALDRIGAGEVDKVVLARRATLAHDRPVDPLAVLQHLEPETPNCFHFAFCYDDGPTFLGASPERLFLRRGERVISEAVAGTRSRADSRRADAALRDELLESDKDRREHAFVEDAIRSTLDALCTSTRMPQHRTEMRLSKGRHLHSRIEGRLRETVSTARLLTALHPTPAVGGVPTAAALDLIRECEDFDRGWYAGPVGWIGANDAEFAVAIRSGLVEGDRLSLFSGAGIVRGSEPDAEWDEIEQKIENFLSLVD
jgi:menaquinone-specific isochorismate synthase